ncbi:MAG TPA: ABC transporter permease [Geminicoccaceae bacterium]|nr:ABC transporter permease [Geminicoccus sp.]HMU49661.1 ABC transporter permease [Geminicoccaceae bacterium]
MSNLAATAGTADAPPSQLGILWRMLLRDRFALVAAIFLLLVAFGALVGPFLLGDLATKVNLRQRNLPPFTLEHGILYVLGADSLGRSLLARIIVGAQTSLAISACVVMVSMIVGGTLGIVAGYLGGWTSTIIMRLTDVIFSFPSLLMALIVLYILGPSILNVIMVLSITRLPIYIRTTRAEVLEIRERMFVSAARALGVSTPAILLRHILPVVFPTIITIGAVDFASVLLSESGLSFLGLGIQPPDFTWGAMVATGRAYLQTAWWLSFWPGLMIMLTTLSLNLLANWARLASDPQQRWRLQGKRRQQP